MGSFYPGGPVAVCGQASSPGTVNQTDVFIVDSTGRLYVYWVNAAGEWSGPGRIGFSSPNLPNGLPPNANLTAINTSDGLTGVFCVDKSGQLVLFTVQNYGIWGGPFAIGPAGAFAPGAAVKASLQSGAGGQVDVFLIDVHGNLVTFWGKLSGGWNGPQVRDGGFSAVQMSGPGVATVPGLSRTMLVAIDAEADLNAFDVVASSAWSNAQVPDTTQIGEFGSPPAVTQRYGTSEALALMVDRYQRLVSFTQDPSGKWSGPVSVHDNISVAGAYVATAQQLGPLAQTDVFVVDTEGRLNVFWIGVEGGWSGPLPIGPAGLLRPSAHLATSPHFGAVDASGHANKTDLFAISEQGDLVMFSVVGTGAWQWQIVPTGRAPPPPNGLSSNSNYLVAADCQPLNSLRVNIEIDQDLTAPNPDSNNASGFSIQLNCLCPQNYTCSVQQYVFLISGNQISASLDWWGVGGNKLLGWPDTEQIVANLPVANSIPAGSQLQFVMFTDSIGRVTDVEFWYTSPQSIVSPVVKVKLLNVPPSGAPPGTPPVSVTGLAPCTVAEINIVAWGNGASTSFSSGSGIISYQAGDGSPLTALSANPLCVTWGLQTITAETSNINYGSMEARADPSLFQHFGLLPLS